MSRVKIFISSVQSEFAKLKKAHASYPANPLIAEPLYLTGYIDKMGTGIPDMIKNCKEAGLREPSFKQDDALRTIIWRTAQVSGGVSGEVSGRLTPQATPQAAPQATPQATPQARDEISVETERIVMVLEGELKRQELQDKLELRDRKNFVANYITPAMELGFIEMKFPDKRTHEEQRYRLTAKGTELKKQLKITKMKK